MATMATMATPDPVARWRRRLAEELEEAGLVVDGGDEWLLFDRPAGSERDLVVLAGVFDATLVQRHPTGSVRLVGPFGVLRWQAFRWHHEPPASTWVDAVAPAGAPGEAAVLEDMLTFAVHDLGSMH